ncbi:hypothetical protein CWI37_1192p0020 [Hamiltosporidium tvaerminnensis]|uniref:Uncharacterized protein n=2 Tax=Hamiltosporidium TaxID=1176354 RepID=A0A4Q9KZN9_9MICR|nr:hypothetical protein CWI37_1192p0020 [Hamiltosporidium tvaerminnensis]TBU00145.1 hypothetical protein CWI39_1775p0010 [Hamiltosporidium magnivora]
MFEIIICILYLFINPTVARYYGPGYKETEIDGINTGYGRSHIFSDRLTTGPLPYPGGKLDDYYDRDGGVKRTPQ